MQEYRFNTPPKLNFAKGPMVGARTSSESIPYSPLFRKFLKSRYIVKKVSGHVMRKQKYHPDEDPEHKGYKQFAFLGK